MNDRGTSELEFALAFPWFLIMVLTTVQMALLINATLVVDYAAFCAARSAAVWLPQELPGESAYIVNDPSRSNSEKSRRIRRAATLGTLPLAPRLSGVASAVLPAGALGGLFEGGGLTQIVSNGVPRVAGVDYARLGIDVLDKGPYAAYFTRVQLVDGNGSPRNEFPAGTPVTARVTHDFYMNVPFAGTVLGAALGRQYVTVRLGRYTLGWGPFYVPVTASYSLVVAQG